MTQPSPAAPGASSGAGEPDAESAEQDHLGRRPLPSWAMIILGYGCIIAGGLVAAVTGPLALADGSWLAAYLVLVGGIAQLGLGWVPGILARSDAGDPGGWIPAVAWNLGNALVITGTLSGHPLGVDAGSVLLIVALLMALMQLRGWRQSGMTQPAAVRLLGWAYAAVLLLLVVSIPVGIVLAHLR